MNRAWRQLPAPTHKLVLMALADAADAHGVCRPSVSTLAKKCSVSTLTVQRALRVLMEQRLPESAFVRLEWIADCVRRELTACAQPKALR